MTGTAVLEYTALGRNRIRNGNRSENAAPQGVYPCKSVPLNDRIEDRWCAITVETDDEWKNLCTVLDRAEFADDERFCTCDARKRHEDEIDDIIGAWTEGQLAEDVMLRLQEAGVAAGVVQNSKDLMETDPQMAATGHYRKVDHAETGPTIYDGPPFDMSATPPEVRPAPLLGEHNEYFFRRMLDLSDDEITEGYVEGFIA